MKVKDCSNCGLELTMNRINENKCVACGQDVRE